MFGETAVGRCDPHAVYVGVENDHAETETQRFYKKRKHRAYEVREVQKHTCLKTFLNAQTTAPNSGQRGCTGKDNEQIIRR